VGGVHSSNPPYSVKGVKNEANKLGIDTGTAFPVPNQKDVCVSILSSLI
jgi:hypothetical protein